MIIVTISTGDIDDFLGYLYLGEREVFGRFGNGEYFPVQFVSKRYQNLTQHAEKLFSKPTSCSLATRLEDVDSGQFQI